MDSERLGTREIEDLFVEAKSVFDLCSLDEFRLGVLDILRRHIHSERGSFLIMDGSELIPYKNYAVARGIDQKYLNLYRRYYHHLNPFAYWKLHTPDKNILTTEDVIPFKRLQKTEYYNDFLKPQCIYHQLIIMLWSGNRIIGAASLYRPKGRRGFSFQDKAKAGLVAPFISVALTKNLAVAKTEMQKNILDAIISETPHQGVIVIDENLTAVYCNEKAVHLFKAAGIESLTPEKLLALFPREIYTACQAYLQGETDKLQNGFRETRFRIDGHSEGCIVAYTRKIGGDHRRRYMMLSLEPEESIKTLNQILAELALTPREIELSNLLAQGLKNSDIADKLCISEYTVQNHLKSIYRKMEVKNRSSLIYRFIQLTSRGNPRLK